MRDTSTIANEDQYSDLDEELIFDIELEVIAHATTQDSVQAVADISAGSDSMKQVMVKLSSLLPSDTFNKQLHSEVVTAKSRLSAAKAGLPALQAIAASLPVYHTYDLFIREAVGSTSAPRCLTQLRHIFVVLASTEKQSNTTSDMDIIIDPFFHESLIIGNATARYQALLDSVPEVYVGSAAALRQLINLIAVEISKSYKTQGMPVPPWRTLKALLSKWLPATAQDHPISKRHFSLPTEPIWALPSVLLPEEPQPSAVPASVPYFSTAPCRAVTRSAPAAMRTVYGFAPAGEISSQVRPEPCQQDAEGAGEHEGRVRNMSLLHGMLTSARCAPGQPSNRAGAISIAQRPALLSAACVPIAEQQFRRPAFSSSNTVASEVKGAVQAASDHSDFYHNVLLSIRKVKLSQRQGSQPTGAGGKLLALKS